MPQRPRRDAQLLLSGGGLNHRFGGSAGFFGSTRYGTGILRGSGSNHRAKRQIGTDARPVWEQILQSRLLLYGGLAEDQSGSEPVWG
jgi:hypothetical protein